MTYCSPFRFAWHMIAALVGSIVIANAAVSSALSPAITVDTRDATELTAIKTKLTAENSKQGHTLVRRHSPAVGLPRNAGEAAYLVLDIPDFDSNGGGWAPRTKGLGAFHSIEIVYQGDKNDRIYQKIGGTPPSTSTPEREWQPVTPNRVMPGIIRKQTRYFKVVFAQGGGEPAKFSIRYHSARLADADGNPVTQLDPDANIWLVFHSRNGGHETLSPLHRALQQARRNDQVVTVDWASGSATHTGWKQPAANASYFRNIGQNLAQLLKQNGFKRQQVNLVGHGWGAIVAHETAARLGGSNHIIALDPTVRGAGAFDGRSVRLSRVSNIATAVKSGSRNDGSIGNESIATTADFAIRLLSQPPSGDAPDSSFYHALPIHWCLQSLTASDTPYWPFLKKSILLRKKAQPELPWLATGTLKGGFQMECLGRTQHDASRSSPGETALFHRITSLAFLRNKQRTYARATLSTDGKTIWKFRRK